MGEERRRPQFRSLSPDDVRELLAAFGAPAYRRHEAVAGGTINTNVRVETDGGRLLLRIDDVGDPLPDEEDGEPVPGPSATLGRFFPEEPSCR